MTGVGGDAFWLVHDAATGRQHVLNASGRAAAAATRDAYAAGGAREIAPRGPRAALTVPGAVDGWVAGARALRPRAVRRLPAARDRPRPRRLPGRRLAGALRRRTTATCSPRRPRRPPRTWAPTARRRRRGDVVRLPRLADTLEAIARDGPRRVLRGRDRRRDRRVPRARTAASSPPTTSPPTARTGSSPPASRYRGRTAVAPPPNSQGFAGLQILGMLEHVDVAALADDPAGYVDVVVRATRARVRGPRPPPLRPGLRRHPARPAARPGVPRRARRAARRRRRAGGRARRAARRRATRRSAARSTPTATPPRSSRASTRSGARASSPATPACCCRTAAASSRSIPRTPTASRPASAPRTR